MNDRVVGRESEELRYGMRGKGALRMYQLCMQRPWGRKGLGKANETDGERTRERELTRG